MTKSIFRATAVLSASSAISIVVSLVMAKVMAVYLQPAGYGYFGLLQSFVAVASLVGGLGIATAIVRSGAAAVQANDQQSVSVLRRACWFLFAILSSVVLIVIAVFRANLSKLVLGSPDHPTAILLMSVAVLFTIAGNIQVGTLNAFHRVGALAKYGVVNSLGGALLSIGCVLKWGALGIIPAVIAGAAVSWLASAYLLRLEVGAIQVNVQWREVACAARSLASFGGPYTASMFVGTGVQLLLPMLVLHLLNPDSVGYYRAAAGISVGYLGFLITAMGQDYYPRVSAAAKSSTELISLINAQHRLVMLIAVPMILATLALVPLLVPIVYSLKFQPTVEILEWQLIGDIFKFASWTMSFAILARCTTRVYFITECIGGAVTLASTWIAVRWLGLPGLGISFLATYAVYYAVVWVVIRQEIPLVWTSVNKRMLIAGVMAAMFVRILPSTSAAAWRTPIGLAIALIAGVPSLVTVLKELRHTAESSVSPQLGSGRVHSLQERA